MLIVEPGGLHSHVDIGSAGAIAQRETLLGTADTANASERGGGFSTWRGAHRASEMAVRANWALAGRPLIRPHAYERMGGAWGAQRA